MAKPLEGIFITVEGIDGSGKTTMVRRLADWVEAQSIPLVLVREPGGTPAGEKIRSIILEGEGVSERCETLLFAAARAEMVDKVIQPALNAHKLVIADRFMDSSIVYQGNLENVSTYDVEKLCSFSVRCFRPDLTLLFDIDPDLAWMRINHGPNRAKLDVIEKRGKVFQRKLHDSYHRLARQEPDRWAVIDASLKPDEVFDQVVEVVEHELRKRSESLRLDSDREGSGESDLQG